VLRINDIKYMPLINRRGQQEKPDYKFGAEYMGGHKAYPKRYRRANIS
jgi:hypothetical protein